MRLYLSKFHVALYTLHPFSNSNKLFYKIVRRLNKGGVVEVLKFYAYQCIHAHIEKPVLAIVGLTLC